MNFIGRLFSRRIRELESELDRVSNDLSVIGAEQYEKLSVTQMVYTPENGLQAAFESNIAKILAAWAFNCLVVADAKNYMEFQVRHPEAGAILITVQRVRGETPGAKAARLQALVDKMSKCCDAQEYGQIGCHCAGYNL